MSVTRAAVSLVLNGQASPTAPMAARSWPSFIAGAAWKIEVVKKPKDQKGFEVLPRRWVVATDHRLDQPMPATDAKGGSKTSTVPKGRKIMTPGIHKDYAAKAGALLCSFMKLSGSDSLHNSRSGLWAWPGSQLLPIPRPQSSRPGRIKEIRGHGASLFDVRNPPSGLSRDGLARMLL